MSAGPDKTYHVLWIRHCESESNVASVTDFQRYNRQPYCTSRGVYQSAAFAIPDLMAERGFEYAGFFSSPLIRAMETAALISGSFARAGWRADAGEYVQRLPTVAEFTSAGDTFARALNPRSGTANTLPIPESDAAARALNESLPEGALKIRADDGDAITSENGGERFFYTPDMYDRFIKETLPDRAWGLIPESSAALNVIVAHGHYINSHVLGEADSIAPGVPRKHPLNLAGYLTEYSYRRGNKPHVQVTGYIAPPGADAVAEIARDNEHVEFAEATTFVPYPGGSRR